MSVCGVYVQHALYASACVCGYATLAHSECPLRNAAANSPQLCLEAALSMVLMMLPSHTHAQLSCDGKTARRGRGRRRCCCCCCAVNVAAAGAGAATVCVCCAASAASAGDAAANLCAFHILRSTEHGGRRC